MLNPASFRTALLACCISAAMVGAADAQERMRGARLIRAFAEAAAANTATVDQHGRGNAGAIVQNGEGNTAGLRQIGRNNTGAITQNGDNNNACLIQIGRGLDGSITQVGDNQHAGVIQTRRGAREIPPELCDVRPNGRGLGVGLIRYAARVHAASR